MSPRDRIVAWLRAGLEAVDPERLTRAALERRHGPLTVLAIGKAAPAMCRGAASSVGAMGGLCVSDHRSRVPDGMELMIGDHPLPSTRSLEAGQRALALASRADVALISGGGSSLCEVPADGITMTFVADVYRSLLQSGASIGETNLVRSHLSKIKGGGLGPIDTYVLSDVAGANPGVVSSGPTIPTDPDPEHALEVMRSAGVEIPPEVEARVRRAGRRGRMPDVVEVIGDGRVAAHAIAEEARRHTFATVWKEWIEGDFRPFLKRLIANAPPGVTVAAGEPSVAVSGTGRGGRSTHSALAAAELIAGTGAWFAALATDGADGSSGSAGAVVDGSTWSRGLGAAESLRAFDSATYLRGIGDLIETGPTGTNVADVWLVWKPENRA